ncbi:MAG: glycine--tRNA ligase subunit alpha, partial [Atopostipes suicloacalis]|nr:glycine--tRNA ligase subunit alpha [Atopostipes suicloacalis]
AYEKEATILIEKALVHPAYDYVLKTSHIFNLIDARGAVSATDRPAYLARIRKMARNIAKAFLNERAKLDFPLLKNNRDEWIQKYKLEQVEK